MTMSSPRVIIIGIGNPLRGDDGAGIAVAHHLKGQFTAEVKIIEEAGDGLLLLEAWRDASSVFLVDAMSSGSAPGKIEVFNVHKQRVPVRFFPCSTHGFGLPHAIALARAIDQLPPEFLIFGIEGELFELGSHMSPRVVQAVGEVATRIHDTIQTQLKSFWNHPFRIA
jgi:hydrogenase maturation protease